MEIPGVSRRRVLRVAATAAAASLLPGSMQMLGEDDDGRQPQPSGNRLKCGLSIPTTKVGSIGPTFMGLSYEKSKLTQRLMTSSNAALIALFKLLSPMGILRVGGNSVDRNLWVGAGDGKVEGSIATGDVDALLGFLQETGWKCLYGVNLGGYRSGVQTPAKAAAEVAYVVSRLGIYDAASNPGGMLYAIEVGNEPENYGLSRGPFYQTTPKWGVTMLEKIADEFYSAILQQTPGVPLTGPACGQFGIKGYTVPFGEYENAKVPKIAAVTQHYYTGNAKATNPPASANGLLRYPDELLESILADMNAAIAGMAPEARVPFRMTECNSYYDGGAPGVSNTYASALWVIDFLFTCAQRGAAGVNLHGGGDSASYVPIADNGRTVDPDTKPGVRPVYYGMLLTAMAGQGELYVCELKPVDDSSAPVNATAWAVKTEKGWNIIVNNKDAVGDLQLEMSLPGRHRSAELIQLSQSTDGDAPALRATHGVTIQGAEVKSDGDFQPKAGYKVRTGRSIACFCPALSAVLVRVEG
jgi:hypothetical protein